MHVRITSPPFKNPCFYGIDTPNRDELIASSKSIEEICREINADSLSFLSPEGLIASIQGNHQDEYKGGLCLACFDNDYPTTLNFKEGAKVGCGC